MKTTLQQLIEELEQLHHEVSCNMGTDQNMGKLEALDDAIELAKGLIEKEKEQIESAHGEDRSYLQDDGSWKRINGNQYYNETFGSPE